jgi:hypothetical protein
MAKRLRSTERDTSASSTLHLQRPARQTAVAPAEDPDDGTDRKTSSARQRSPFVHMSWVSERSTLG